MNMRGIDLSMAQYFQNNDLLPKYEKLMRFLKSDYVHIKEYLCQQSFYTNISIGYFKLLLSKKSPRNLESLKQILLDVYTGRVNVGKSKYLNTFCGYLKHLIQNWNEASSSEMNQIFTTMVD